MDFRWLTPDEIVTHLNPALQAQGKPILNVNEAQPTCRVLGAFWDNTLVEAFAMHLFPVLGPLIKTDNTFRDNGDTARTLAQMMSDFLTDAQARGWLVICDSPISERLAQRHHMTKVTSPVYVGSAHQGVGF